MRELTDQQAGFVAAFTSDPGAIGNASEAARRAGYSTTSAREIGRQLLDKPHVRAAIDDANRAQISGKLATKAVEVLEGILNDEQAPPKLRLDAAKTVLDRAGFIAPKAEERQPEGSARKPINSMSKAELEQFVAEYRERQASQVDDAGGNAMQH
jgi:phage terminase small subunit